MEGNITLYKYLDAKGGLMMLQNSNLQFTNATRLNDPFDCHPALLDFSNAPVNEHNWPPADFLKEKGITDMENLRSSAWICSLSKVNDSLLMWTYYGNHNGVCVGLDMEKVRKYLSNIYCKIFVGAMEMEVQYIDVVERPDYFYGANDYFHYLLSTKAKEWEHEQEVRLLLIDPTPAWIPNQPFFAPMMRQGEQKNEEEIIDKKEFKAYPHLGGECFESLYLGIKMDEQEKIRIIEAARKCNQNVKIYQMAVEPEALKLKEELLSH